jgi:putative peptide zinc metalloprotease protein
MLIVVLGAVILSTRMLAGITSILRSAAAHSRRGRLSPRRAIAAGVVGPAALLALLLWPWPRHARAPAVIRGGDARPAFVSLPGRIHAAAGVEYGCIVQQGQVLATLVNRELEQSVAELRGEVALQRRKVELLETRLVSSPQAAAQLPAAQAALAALVERLRGREGELDRLTLRAPAAGLLLPPDSPDAGSAAERRMALGGPLSADKDGAWLEAGLAVAVVADPRRREATAYVDQAEAALIAPGTSARVCAEQSAGGVQTGSVSDVSMRPALEIPLALALRGDVPIQPAAGGRVIPARPLHEVRVRLAETSPPLAVGQPARVRISLGRESLWAKLCRWAQLTLKLD